MAEGAARLRVNLQLTTLNFSHPVIPPEKPTPKLAELYRFLEEMEMTGTLREARQRYDQLELF